MPSLPLLSAIIMGLYIAIFLTLTSVSAGSAKRPVWLFGIGGQQGVPALLFRVSFIAGFVYPLLVASGFEPVREFLDLPFPVRGVGLVLALGGALFAIRAQSYMGASWRIGSAAGHSGAIVDSGPFGLSRNPVFVGQVVLFVGFVLVRPDPVQAFLAAAVMLAVGLQVRIEEKVLERDLGAPYLAYRQRVRRWL